MKQKIKIKIAQEKPKLEIKLRHIFLPLIIGFVVAGLFSTALYALASPPGSPYNPGETLNPSCAPGDTNCTTVSPVTSSVSSLPSLAAISSALSGIIKASSGNLSAAISGTDYAPATSGTSILKGDGSGGFSNATAGTDYAPATSGTSILKGDGSGGFSNATSGTDYLPVTGGSGITTLGTIGTGTWNGTVIAPTYGGTGENNGSNTATLGGDLSTANAFATSGNNPLTLTTTGSTNVTLPTSGTLVNTEVNTLSSLVNIGSSLSGLLKASSGTLSAAVSGTDYVTPSVSSLSSLTTVGNLTSGSIGTGFVVKGVTMTLGSDATGDTYYRNSSGNFTRLGIGSTGQVLTVSGGLPSWQPIISGVSSVANSNGTLTISPTSGSVVASLNTGHANTWTADQSFASGTLQLLNSGASSIITLNNPAIGSTNYSVNLPAANDTLVGKATTDTLTNKTLASSTDSLGQVTMGLGSDATGDIYYRNSAGVLTRLGIGSSGNVLQVSGGLPSWQTASGGGAFSTFGTGNILSTDAGNGTMTGKYNFFALSNAGFRNTTGSNNNFLGQNAGLYNTGGYSNNFFGNSTGQTNTTGYYNNFLGYTAGYANTSGANNNFFGADAGFHNTTGSNNNFLGNNAGSSNTVGNANNFFGANAGYSNINGADNNFLGNAAGRSNGNGSENNFFGAGAGSQNTNGSDNNFLGQNAGNDNISGADNNFLGLDAGFSNYSGNENNFLGNTAGFQNSTGYDNNFLGDGAGNVNTTGYNNNFFGYYAGGSDDYTIADTGYNNNFFGAYTGQENTTGTDNNFLGFDAGQANTGGGENNFLGYGTGQYNTTGSDNNFLGQNAGGVNTTGAENNFIGVFAGVENTVGSNNNFFGSQAGYDNTDGSDNNFLGDHAGYYNNGDANNFLGEYAGYSNTTGDNNDFFGDNAGRRNTSGQNNVFIGYNAGANQTTVSNQLIIDASGNRGSAAYDLTKSLIVGQFGTPSSSIGSNTQDLTINAGQVALPYLPAGGGFDTVEIDPSTGQLYDYSSSEEYKTDIQPLDDNWDALLQVQPKSYTYINGGDASIGFLAQDFDALGLKDLVTYKNGQPHAIQYELISVYLTEIAKQQQQEIDALNLLAGINSNGSTGNGEAFSGESSSGIMSGVSQLLSDVGITIANGVTTITNLTVSNTLTAQTASISKGIELTDQATGQVYCTFIEDGQWQKALGNCATVMAALPEMAQTTSSSSSPEDATTPATEDQIDQTNNEVQQVTNTVNQVAQQLQQVAQTQTQTNQQAQQSAQQAQQSAQTAQQAAQQAQQATPTINKADLEAAIGIAQSETQSDYTSDSWTNLQTALDAAQAEDQNAQAQQSDVDDATTNLNTAIGALAQVSASSTGSENSGSSQDNSLIDTTSGVDNLIQSGASDLIGGFLDILRYFFGSAAKTAAAALSGGLNHASAALSSGFENNGVGNSSGGFGFVKDMVRGLASFMTFHIR